MASSERQPDFFLVGAPKCGTTAMHVSLREHPDVFMPAEKEHNHFATDLVPATDPYASREHYLALFRDASFEKRVGETSVFHLYSKSAAENIRAFHADAKILVMLRDPLEFVASYHSQMVWNGDEDLADLAEALDAEDVRRAGAHVPANLRFPDRLFYTDVARFSEQLERYIGCIGSDAIHVVLFDDFTSDPAAEYRRALRFLGVDEDFAPTFRVVNPNKAVRSAAVSEFLRRPPAWVAKPVVTLLPRSWRRTLRIRVRHANAAELPRTPLSDELHARLVEVLRPEVDRLEALLGRSLPGWCAPR